MIRKIYDDFIRAVDLILSQPHHVLETIHEVTPQHKAKRLDAQSRKWIEKHPQQAQLVNGQVLVNKVLSSKKIVTYDTKENRLTKYILMSTVKRLESFKRNYLHLQRKEDAAVIALLDEMIKGLNRRCNTSFLQGVSAYEATSGMSLVFTMAPGYRDLYKYYLMLLRGLSVTGDVFNISVKDLAVLYEYWCFIKLNSMMKERYQLVSQDIIRVQGNGLYVSLVKGQGSRVKYRNPHNGETITLSYNPRAVNVPTVTQRPDNVLTLEKKGAQMQYEYVFDAKYRLNPALPGTDYYNAISHTPGPEVDDINTMHRYRDAIVYRNGASPFERTMFGAYVLFPYNNESEYQNHRFYEGIRKVNIGGIPFLPSAVDLVSDMLDELIADSPESAFERATLPVGIEDRLAKVDWNTRDVLIGSLRTAEQLDVCLQHGFYHIPAKRIKDSDFPIRYVALYQSGKKFGGEAGVQYYGEVTKCIPLPRSEITEIPKDSDELYYRFEVKEWKKLKKRVLPKERGFVKSYTNMFLLEHSSEMPELWLRSEEEYRLYTELRRALKSVEIDDSEDVGFKYDNSLVVFDQGEILLYQDGTIQGKYDVKDFSRTLNAIFRRIHKQMGKSEGEE